MDFEAIEHVLLPFFAAILGGLGTWLKLRSDTHQQGRDAQAQELAALWIETRSLRTENKELRQENRDLRAEVLETKGELQAVKTIISTIAAALDLNCPYDGERCLLAAMFKQHVGQSSGQIAASATQGKE